MFKRIVVGIDGSPSSVNASKLALKIGGFLSIPVVGVHVIDARLLEESFIADLAGVLGFTYYEGISAKVRGFLEKRGDAVLTEFSALGRELGARVSVVQVTGVPYRELVAQADAGDLMAVGRTGSKPIKGVLIGSSSEKVIRNAPCSVLLTPSEEREIRKVLCAYDGSASSRLALKICSSFRKLFGYEVKILHVEEERKIDLEEVGKIIGEDYELLTTTGFPEEKIVQTVEDIGIDMVFMGAFGKGGFREFFLGSVTSFVTHHLTVPVLLAKSRDRLSAGRNT